MTVSVVTRKPVLRVWIDGREVVQRFSGVVRYGLDLRIAEAEIPVPIVPAWAVPFNPTTGRGSLVTIVMGPTPAQAYGRFTGFYAGCSRTLWPRGAVLLCRGLLERARSYEHDTAGGIDLAGDTGASDGAMVGTVLDACGLTVAEVGARGGTRPTTFGGTGKTLGTVAWSIDPTTGDTISPFVWREGESALSVIERLDTACLGWRLFETFGGTICRGLGNANPIGTIATTTPSATFTEGVDIFSADESEDALERKNRVVVTGCDDGTGIPLTHTTQEAGAAAYITESLSNDMIEKELTADAGDGLSCQEVSEWQYNELNRTVVKLKHTTPRGDMLGPGQTIRVEGAGGVADRLALAQNLWLQHVEVEISETGEFTQRLTCLTGRGDTPAPDLPPLASFDMTTEKELIVSGTSEIPLYIVHCRPGAMGISGTIASYAWTATGGTPASGTGEMFTTSYTDPASKSIDLEVTDSGALTGVATKPVPAATSVLWTRRPLYYAATTAAEAFDGRINRSVAEAGLIVVSNGPIWSAGPTVYPSTDYLATPPSSSIPKAGVGVTSLWVETDITAQKILAGLDDGSVYLSSDAGATWSSLGSPEASPILRVIINRYATGQYFALTASGYYDTVDGGASWSNRNPAPAGVTWYDVAHSWDRAYVVVGDDGSGNPYAEDGVKVAQTFPGGAAGLYAVTARIDGGYACYDSAKATYLSPSGSDTFTAATDLPAGIVVQPRGLWRDGAINELYYIAGGTGGAWKSIDGFGSAGGYFQIRAPGVGNSPVDADYTEIGSDGLYYAAPAVTAQLYVTDGRIMHFISLSPTGYTFADGGLPGGYSCTRLASDGVDPTRMYAVVDNIVYTSTDAGANWTSLSWPAGGWTVNDVSANATVAGEVWAAISTGNDADADNGFYRSTDYGATWTQRGSHYDSGWGKWQGGNSIRASALRVVVGYDKAYLAGGWLGRSNDGGATWAMLLQHPYSRAVAMARLASDHYLTYQADESYSVNAWAGPGLTINDWSTNSDRDTVVRALMSNGSCYLTDCMWAPDGSFLLLILSTDGIYRSADDGASWTQVDSNPHATGGGMDIAAGGLTCYSGAAAGRLYYSADSGVTWSSFVIDRAIDIKAIHVTV